MARWSSRASLSVLSLLIKNHPTWPDALIFWLVAGDWWLPIRWHRVLIRVNRSRGVTSDQSLTPIPNSQPTHFLENSPLYLISWFVRSALHRLLTDGVLCIFDQFSDQLNATAFVLSLTLTIAFLTNAVCNLDKYSLHFGEIHFALVTVIDHRQFSNNLERLLKLIGADPSLPYFLLCK